MKKWSLLFVLMGCICFVTAQTSADSAKSPEKIAQPELMNHLYYYNSTQNKAVALEKTEVTMKSKVKMGGFGGGSSAYIIEGEKSKIRFSRSEKIEFSIKMSSMMGMGMDPGSMNILRKFDISDKSRRSVMQESGFMGKSGKQNMEGIKCALKQLSDGIYLLIPEKPLDPGEYAFISMMTPVSNSDPKNPKYGAFAFGIDP